MVSRTTVVVAHRLSIVRNADMIDVIHQGKVVEKGSHSDLLVDVDGAYSQLIRLQELNKETHHQEMNDQQKEEITVQSSRHSSKRMSLPGSISRGSSYGVGNISRHSFSVSFGIPTDINIAHEFDTEFPQTSEQAPDVPFSRLAYLNKPEIPILVLGTIAAVANGIIYPTYGVHLFGMVKTFYEPPSELRRDSRFWALMFVGLGSASLVASPARTYFFTVAGCKLIKRVRLMCFEKVVNMEVGWFDEPENSSGVIGARLSGDAASLRVVVGDALALLVQNTTTTVVGLVDLMSRPQAFEDHQCLLQHCTLKLGNKTGFIS